MKKSVWDVLTNIAVFFKWFYIVCGIGIIVLLSVTFNSCNEKENDISIYGDFLYNIVYYDKSGNKVSKNKGFSSEIRILGLSEEGKKKEVIIFPQYINGVKINSIGSSLWYFNIDVWEENNILKKIIIPYNLNIKGNIFQNCNALERVIIFAHETEKNFKSKNSTYVTSYFYNENDVTNVFDSERGNLHFANVSYLYNYENAPNINYYWIDDYDYGEKIEFIPPTPTREGYEFGGWYKESECINAWDFNVDTLPEVKYVDFVPQHQEKHEKDNKTLYQETKLYAKWIEIGG